MSGHLNLELERGFDALSKELIQRGYRIRQVYRANGVDFGDFMMRCQMKSVDQCKHQFLKESKPEPFVYRSENQIGTGFLKQGILIEAVIRKFNGISLDLFVFQETASRCDSQSNTDILSDMKAIEDFVVANGGTTSVTQPSCKNFNG